MKKLLGILVLGLLWCNLSFAGAAGGYKELTKYNAAPGGGALTVFSL